MNIKEFLQFLEKKFGKLSSEEGIKYGDEKEEIKGITVSWMATEKIIKNASKRKHNLIISHEDILFPPEYTWEGKEERAIVSEKRLKELGKNKINVVRIHSTVDKHFIFRNFANSFGLTNPVVEDGIFFIYEIKPDKFGNLCKKKNKIKIYKESRE